MSASVRNSSSGVMNADWTKNLSLHFACGGGSVVNGCKRTITDQRLSQSELR